MALTEDKIAMAVARGLSVVCATCERYWQARDFNIPDNKCLANDGCGSPIAGDVFHEYKGPMVSFDQWCFVCGANSTHAIRVDNSARVVGCCRDHVGLIKTLKAEGKRAPNVVLISKDGEEVVDEASPPPKQVLRMRG